MDSQPLILLFLMTLGLMVVGAVFFFLWTIAAGHWKNSEDPKYKILEVESNGTDKKT